MGIEFVVCRDIGGWTLLCVFMVIFDCYYQYVYMRMWWLYDAVYMTSWQSCTGDVAPIFVIMHGVRVVCMYEEAVEVVVRKDRGGGL